jgi:hypothetical protein
VALRGAHTYISTKVSTASLPIYRSTDSMHVLFRVCLTNASELYQPLELGERLCIPKITGPSGRIVWIISSRVVERRQVGLSLLKALD